MSLRRLAILLLAALALVPAIPAADGPGDFGPIRALVAEHCLDCHGDAKGKGGVNLAIFQSLTDVQRNPGQWDNVLHQIRDEAMPPAKHSELAAGDRATLVAWIGAALDSAEAIAPKDPGKVVLHRLSRAEYDNTIRDLLGVDTKPARNFPVDGGGGGGFDNTADTLFIPALLFEKLMAAAEEVIAAAKPERILIAKPAADTPKARKEAARIVMADFARRAFRRPVTPSEVDRLLKVFDADEKRGWQFEDAIRHALKAVLVAPDFLYRGEAQKPVLTPYPLGDYEIACRLSYFLWSSMPDDALFALAAAGKLQDDAVIESEVRRMLADPKARALGDNFARQWLQLGNLEQGGGPDPMRYPNYTTELRDAMCAEPVAYFNALVREGRSVLELIESDYTFVNERLAGHYDMTGVRGDEMQKVALRDANRGGVLGMAGVLATTSHAGRTSPVLRGKWMLQVILNTPPPPPPPNVTLLAKEESPADTASLRVRLQAHRDQVACAGCHSRIDPLGFGLENFDPLGRWRDQDVRGEAIDASGELPGGQRFNGPRELRALLISRKDEFVRALTEKLLGYALGRGLEFYDRTTVKRIVAEVAADGYKADRLVVAIARSYPFRFARNRPQLAGPPAAPPPSKPLATPTMKDSAP